MEDDVKIRSEGHSKLLSNVRVGLFVVASALTLVAAFMGYLQNQSSTTEINRSSSHSSDLVWLKTALLNAETGQRGFLLTGEDKYLDAFNMGTNELESAIDAALAEKHYTDVFPRENADQIEALAQEKVAELRETIALYRQGETDAAMDLVKTDQGKQIMDRLRLLIEAELSSEDSREQLALNSLNRANWLMISAGFILCTLIGGMLSYIAMTAGRVRRTELAEAAAETAEADEEYVRNIAHELNHRLKNTFGIATGMLRQTARGKSAEVREYAEGAANRLLSMSVAYSMTDELGEPRRLQFSELVQSVVKNQLLPENDFELSGINFILKKEKVSSLAMILHELTTNALKFGAWRELHEDRSYESFNERAVASASFEADPSIIEFPATSEDVIEPIRPSYSGSVSLACETREDGSLSMVWTESVTGASVSAPTGSGYGSKLVKICAAQLGAEVRHDWNETGLTCSLVMDADKIVAA